MQLHSLIIGGTRGIGFEIARQLLEIQHRVTLTGRSQVNVDAALGRLANPDAHGLAVDILDREAASAALAPVAAFDHLILVGSSGGAWGAFRELDMAALIQALEMKLIGYLGVTQMLLPKLASQGSVTFLGGAASRAAIPGTAGLAAVNGGLEAVTRTLAKELAPRRVNLVSPGLTDTEAYAYLSEEARFGMFAAAASRLPVGRVGSVNDIAGMVLSVIQNGYVTGAVIDVDGGAHLG